MRLKKIFSKTKHYDIDEIYNIANNFGLSTTDCMKDDNEITIAKDDESEPLWVFAKFDNKYSTILKFKLVWSFFLVEKGYCEEI